MSFLVVLPVIVPLVTAALCLAVHRWHRTQQIIGIAGTAVLFGVSIALMARVWTNGPTAVAVAGWSAPLGIVLVADTLAALMVLVTGFIGTAVAIYALADIRPIPATRGFFAVYHVLLAGACGAFLTGDLFNLFVWIEVLLSASFVLLVMGRSRSQLEGALKYVSINLVGSTVLLSAVGLTYATTKTLNMAHVALRLEWLAAERPGLMLAITGLYGVAFGLKAALFPLFSWLPPSYPTPPPAVSAIFSGLLTKVGVYAFFRIFTTVLPVGDAVYWVVLVVSCATMTLGVFGAVAQSHVRRILSFHIVSQIGYMVAAVGLLVAADPRIRHLALAAGIFYTVHNILAKCNLFLVAGAIEQIGGSTHLDRLGGLAKRAPLWAGSFVLSAFALAGLPPLSGFWAKLAIVWASIAAGQWWVAAIALFVGMFTLVSMLKIWNGAFWKPAPEDQEPQMLGRRRAMLMAGPSVAIVATTVLIGLVPMPLFAVAERAATELLSPADYQAVQGVELTPAWPPGASEGD